MSLAMQIGLTSFIVVVVGIVTLIVSTLMEYGTDWVSRLGTTVLVIGCLGFVSSLIVSVWSS